MWTLSLTCDLCAAPKIEIDQLGTILNDSLKAIVIERKAIRQVKILKLQSA